MPISPPICGTEEQGVTIRREPSSSKCQCSYYLGIFGLFGVGLPEKNPADSKATRPPDPVLKSLDHRAPSPLCHPERSRGTLCLSRDGSSPSKSRHIGATGQQQIFRLWERTRK